MSSTKHRNPPSLDKRTKDFNSKKKTIQRDVPDDDLFDPKKPARSLFDQFIELDLQVGNILDKC